jgi:hypothetical protein
MLNLIEKMYIFLISVFHKGNLWKILIIFIIGLVCRSVVNYVYDINVFTDNIYSILVIYYTYMGIVSILFYEVVSYLNFPSISNEVFKISSIIKGVSDILKRFIGSENKIVLGMKSIDCKYRNNSSNKVLNILSMNESDKEDFIGGSKVTGENKETGENTISKEIKLEDVSYKEVRRYWYNMSKWGFWNWENGGSGSFLDSGGPKDPFNKEDYVKWLNGKYMNENKNIDRVYDSNTEIKSYKEREEELLKYWRFMLEGEGNPKNLPINTTSNELIESRDKVLIEIKESSKEREKELLKYWRYKLKGEGDTKSLPLNTTSNELIYTRQKVVQEIIKSNVSSNANVNSNNGNSN